MLTNSPITMQDLEDGRARGERARAAAETYKPKSAILKSAEEKINKAIREADKKRAANIRAIQNNRGEIDTIEKELQSLHPVKDFEKIKSLESKKDKLSSEIAYISKSEGKKESFYGISAEEYEETIKQIVMETEKEIQDDFSVAADLLLQLCELAEKVDAHLAYVNELLYSLQFKMSDGEYDETIRKQDCFGYPNYTGPGSFCEGRTTVMFEEWRNKLYAIMRSLKDKEPYRELMRSYGNRR